MYESQTSLYAELAAAERQRMDTLLQLFPEGLVPAGNGTTPAERPDSSLVDFVQSLPWTTRFGIAVCFVLWLVWTVSRHRAFYKTLVSSSQYPASKKTDLTSVQPTPPHSWWFGHLRVWREVRRSLPYKTHPHAIILAIKKKFNMPGVFFLDWYPIFDPMIIITDPTVATQLTNAENLPRHSVVQDVMGELVGRHSVFWSQPPEWKYLRTTLTPGFSTTFLLGRVPRMLHHMLVFEEIAAKMASSGEAFPVLGKLISLTIDVIGDLMLDMRLDAQSEKEFDPIVREFRAAMKYTWQGLNFWEKYINLPGLRWHSHKLDDLLAQAISKRYEEQVFQAPETWAGIDLFLKKYDQEQGEKARGKPLDKLFLEQCVHK